MEVAVCCLFCVVLVDNFRTARTRGVINALNGISTGDPGPLHAGGNVGDAMSEHLADAKTCGKCKYFSGLHCYSWAEYRKDAKFNDKACPHFEKKERD